MMLLDNLSQILPEKTYGLYRDDGLAYTSIAPPSSLERLKKKITSKFKEVGFRITIDIGDMKTNFLDITLDIANNRYSPYRKPNSRILYINKKSNHPKYIKNAIPTMIQRRLVNLSKTEEDFDQCKSEYQNALKSSGFDHELKFEEPEKKRKQRRRKCLFFNPPYCQSVRNNIGRAFLKLIDKHFTKKHYYRKIFNRYTLKLSYSCMTNMKAIIQSHNQKILREKQDNQKKKCNCQKSKKEACPLIGECNIKNVIYEASVISEKSEKKYVGSTGGEFKKRWYQHMSDFRNKNKRTSTELSKHIWELKDNGIKYRVNWKILRKVKQTDDTINKVCTTCNLEKLEIACADKNIYLNKKIRAYRQM